METRSDEVQEVQVPSEHVAVVAMFADRETAETAVDALLERGFTDDQISLVARGAYERSPMSLNAPCVETDSLTYPFASRIMSQLPNGLSRAAELLCGGRDAAKEPFGVHLLARVVKAGGGAATAGPSAPATRPFSLRHVVPGAQLHAPSPWRYTYCPERQIALVHDGDGSLIPFLRHTKPGPTPSPGTSATPDGQPGNPPLRRCLLPITRTTDRDRSHSGARSRPAG